jgi:alkanesulfonate monooxygenase SsuD/methylene tetrahydromethanopterin reductase-like flavin-dependent oxidoreductase (luciferase family)
VYDQGPVSDVSNLLTPHTGVWMFPAAPAPQLVEAVVRAEQLGLDDVWIADGGIAQEPMAVLAFAARETSVI